MALLTLTINNPSTALDKQHQETQLIARAAPSATGYPREWREENVRQHQRRRRRFTRDVDLYAGGDELIVGENQCSSPIKTPTSEQPPGRC
jgi:hypothetical protein